jgi:hypothetical protein
VSKALVRAFERTDRGVIQKVHHAFEIGLGNVAKVTQRLTGSLTCMDGWLADMHGWLGWVGLVDY